MKNKQPELPELWTIYYNLIIKNNNEVYYFYFNALEGRTYIYVIILNNGFK